MSAVLGTARQVSPCRAVFSPAMSRLGPSISMGPHQPIEDLLDERDQLLLEVSLEADAARPSPDKLEALSKRMVELEIEIERRWRDLREREPS